MSEEENGGNSPATNQDGSNAPEGQKPKEKAPDQNPLFPAAAGHVPTGADEPEEEVDPRIAEIRNDSSYQKCMKDAGTPEIAYKRWMDSAKEAKRLADERETYVKSDSTLKAVKRDFDIMAQMDPDLYKKVVSLFQKLESGEDPGSNAPTNPSPQSRDTMSEEQVGRLVELQTTLSEFRRDYKDVISDDADLSRIRKYAASKAGLEDRNGKPFSYRDALAAGLEYYHPEINQDQAKMEAMAALERRNSASEPGNVPSGSPSKGRLTPLTPQEKMVADQFGMTEAEYRKYQVE